ncbi:MAG: hypothetical protein ACTSRW_17590 [Candidatus Helarchaeota archaeon]
MKASLQPRKKIRLEWFTLKNIPYEIEREVEIKYSVSRAQSDKLEHVGKQQYVFKNVSKEIPQTDLILLEYGLPTLFTKTPGSIGEKITSEKLTDTSITITDQLVKVDRGKEEIKREPPEFPDPKIKEIETRTRKDVIRRKITIKNESNRRMENCKIIFIEVKQVRYTSSKPEPIKVDLPEYHWSVSLDPDESTSIEITVTVEIVKTFKIEKEKEIKITSKSQ